MTATRRRKPTEAIPDTTTGIKTRKARAAAGRREHPSLRGADTAASPTRARARAKAKAKSKARIEVEVEVEVEAKAVARARAKTRAKVESKAKAEIGAKAKAKAETEAKAKTKAASGPTRKVRLERMSSRTSFGRGGDSVSVVFSMVCM